LYDFYLAHDFETLLLHFLMNSGSKWDKASSFWSRMMTVKLDCLELEDRNLEQVHSLSDFVGNLQNHDGGHDLSSTLQDPRKI
jgi:hypothetical protein